MADLYVQRSDGSFATYSGMDQSAVNALLADLGVTGTFLTWAQYQTALESLPKPAPVNLAPLEAVLGATPTTDTKLNALIALLQAKGVI
jgi:hypothetical protein